MAATRQVVTRWTFGPRWRFAAESAPHPTTAALEGVRRFHDILRQQRAGNPNKAGKPSVLYQNMSHAVNQLQLKVPQHEGGELSHQHASEFFDHFTHNINAISNFSTASQNLENPKHKGILAQGVSTLATLQLGALRHYADHPELSDEHKALIKDVIQHLDAKAALQGGKGKSGRPPSTIEFIRQRQGQLVELGNTLKALHDRAHQESQAAAQATTASAPSETTQPQAAAPAPTPSSTATTSTPSEARPTHEAPSTHTPSSPTTTTTSTTASVQPPPLPHMGFIRALWNAAQHVIDYTARLFGRRPTTSPAEPSAAPTESAAALEPHERQHGDFHSVAGHILTELSKPENKQELQFFNALARRSGKGTRVRVRSRDIRLIMNHLIRAYTVRDVDPKALLGHKITVTVVGPDQRPQQREMTVGELAPLLLKHTANYAENRLNLIHTQRPLPTDSHYRVLSEALEAATKTMGQDATEPHRRPIYDVRRFLSNRVQSRPVRQSLSAERQHYSINDPFTVPASVRDGHTTDTNPKKYFSIMDSSRVGVAVPVPFNTTIESALQTPDEERPSSIAALDKQTLLNIVSAAIPLLIEDALAGRLGTIISPEAIISLRSGCLTGAVSPREIATIFSQAYHLSPRPEYLNLAGMASL